MRVSVGTVVSITSLDPGLDEDVEDAFGPLPRRGVVLGSCADKSGQIAIGWVPEPLGIRATSLQYGGISTIAEAEDTTRGERDSKRQLLLEDGPSHDVSSTTVDLTPVTRFLAQSLLRRAWTAASNGVMKDLDPDEGMDTSRRESVFMGSNMRKIIVGLRTLYPLSIPTIRSLRLGSLCSVIKSGDLLGQGVVVGRDNKGYIIAAVQWQDINRSEIHTLNGNDTIKLKTDATSNPWYKYFTSSLPHIGEEEAMKYFNIVANRAADARNNLNPRSIKTGNDVPKEHWSTIEGLCAAFTKGYF